MCDDFGLASCISFNSSKYGYIVFTPRKFNLFIPDMYSNSTGMNRSFDTKYLGFRLNAKLYYDDDILK